MSRANILTILTVLVAGAAVVVARRPRMFARIGGATTVRNVRPGTR